jgi:hypothetical protein
MDAVHGTHYTQPQTAWHPLQPKANRSNVIVADVPAAGPFGPGLPQSTPARRVSAPSRATVTHLVRTYGA